MGKVALTIVGIAAAFSSFAGAAHAASGQAAIEMLVGNTIIGEGQGRNFFAFFATDGVMRSLLDTRRDDGHWTARGGKLCLTPPDGQPCFAVEIVGDVVTLTGPSTIKAKLLKGNAKDLN